MKRRVIRCPWGFIAAGWFAALMPVAADLALYRVVELDGYSEEPESPMARWVLKSRPADEWKVAESDHFISYAATVHRAGEILEEAEFAYDRISAMLGVPDSGRRSHLFVVDDPAVWTRMMKRYRLRPDSLAMHWRSEMFFKDDPEQNERPDRVAHEIVHHVLMRICGESIPLWLDEGLANHFGWEYARAFHALAGNKLVRTMPPVPPDDLMTLPQVLDCSRYPDHPAAVAAFYRQSEELVFALTERIGALEWPGFIESLCRNEEPLGDLLTGRFGLPQDATSELEKDMRARSARIRIQGDP